MSRRVAPVDEVICRLEADGRTLHVFHCTPDSYIELAAGWLVGEGMVRPDGTEPLPLVVHLLEEGAVVRFESAGSTASTDSTGGTDGRGGRAPAPSDLGDAFRELYARATRYQDTGGMHAAAIVQDGRVVAHAEDVGRHNAVDKAIGRAVLAGCRLSRCGLVTTARVSGEMARKAAAAGLAWIASRSVPTTLALANARRAGVIIVARAASAEARVFAPDERPLGVILAGGRNLRFGGRAKALEPVGGRRIIERAADALRPLCADVVMIANDPASYAEIDLRARPDTGPAAGPVGGVREAVAWAGERALPGALVVACDMPFVSTSLLDALWRASDGADGAVPESGGRRGLEPLCAAYRTSCLGAIGRAIERDDLRVIGFFDEADIRRLPLDDVTAHGDPARLFFNVNTPEELERAREMVAGSPPIEGSAR
ncbi:MAG TPA: formate dehydrogenase accessory sulfurtransferase FdhD [Longimicrobiales bacterium]|nr:formate dehydrogenase accessory sulfurtransferase FdhD [Longimicrobiales bacterium]